MKKITLGLLSFASFVFANEAFAEDPSSAQAQAPAQSISSNFTPAQLGEIEKIVADYLAKHPDTIMASFQAAQEQKQKEAVAKMEKAVIENKDKIFKNAATPNAGNPKGTQSLVVFMDPYCGYCKKFHGELATLLNKNKDVKVIFKDIAIMGPNSTVAIKAMLAAKDQGKYDELQKAIFSSEKSLTKKQLLKMAKSVGIDTKKLSADMENKATQAQLDQNLELSKLIGVNGTPTLILGEKTVVPGYLSADELNAKLQEVCASANKMR